MLTSTQLKHRNAYIIERNKKKNLKKEKGKRKKEKGKRKKEKGKTKK
jgi:hypothetical protein